ncbi:MAG: hypothetical protein ACKVT2_21615 [Saprospiraceae bacterium]
MSKNLFSFALFAFLLGLFAEKINAQASGVKPELFMYRHNGSMGGSPLPAVTGNTLGTIQWRGLTAIGSVLNGATIRSEATHVSPGILRANMIFRTSGTMGLLDHMIITDEGRVGIGTNTPAILPHDFKLHVVGNTHTSGRFHGRIHYDNDPANALNNLPSTYTDEAYFERKNRSVLDAGLPANAAFNNPLFPTGGTLTLAPGGGALDRQIFSGGNDGIWTRAQRVPFALDSWDTWYKFLTSEDINGNVGRVPVFFGATIGDPSSALRNSQLFDNGTNIAIGGAHPASPPPFALFDSDYRLTVNGLASGAAMFVDGRAYVNGNMGIGTEPTAAGDRLEVSGTSHFTDNMGIGTSPTLDNRLEVSGNSHFDMGNMGVGTSPTLANRLEVSGNSHFFDGNMGIGNAVPTDFRLEVTGNCRFNDRVMINTGDPIHPGALEHQLYVQGSILAEEVKVELQSSWPDYVYAEDYELKPLSEIEKFVKENKHLPGVPSAAEVAENGLSLGETQKVQMEKIEELYLHMIDMEKRMNALETQNKQLQAENVALKAEISQPKK